MKEGICYIVGAGECFGLDFLLTEMDYLIAADGGLRHVEAHNLSAHMVVGDFDSYAPPPKHPNLIQLHQEKDETDLFAALQEGIRLGYRRFHLYCATGGRIDHTMANLQLLTYLSRRNLSGHLFDAHSIITAITNGAITFSSQYSGNLSLFSADVQALGVSVTGLKYPLERATLTSDFPLGISNEFIGVGSRITVEKGTLLLVYPRWLV